MIYYVIEINDAITSFCNGIIQQILPVADFKSHWKNLLI